MTVLEYLEDNMNEYLSGQVIADNLNMTRANVWKEIEKLRQNGIVIEAKTRHGYKLISHGPYISKSYLLKALEAIKTIEIVDSCTSTNDLAKDGNHDLYITQHQTKGRGRQGREFISPKGKGLYFSLNVIPDFTTDHVPLMTICAALAVQETLFEYLGSKVGIKWLNDILVDNVKLCGILVEGDLELQTMTFNKLTVGIGINLYKTDEHEFTSLEDHTDKEINVHMILIGIISKFQAYVNDLGTRKTEIIDKYKAHSIVIGKNVTVKDKTFKATGISNQGHLIVEDSKGQVHELNSGEISINYEN